MHSRYLGYSMWVKSMAFTPCIVFFIIFFVLVAVYGRISDPDPNVLGSASPAGGGGGVLGMGEEAVESGGVVGEEEEGLEEEQQLKRGGGGPAPAVAASSRRRPSIAEQLLCQGEVKTDL